MPLFSVEKARIFLTYACLVKRGRWQLDVKSEMDDVAIFYDVVFAL